MTTRMTKQISRDFAQNESNSIIQTPPTQNDKFIYLFCVGELLKSDPGLVIANGA